MKTLKNPLNYFGSLSLVLSILCSGLVPGAQAEIVFDSSGTERANYYPSLMEHGDELRLAGSARTVTDFFFEYFGDFEATGVEKGRVRFYENDGPGAANLKQPGTLLYDSGEFDILDGYRVQALTGLSIQVPDIFTWTIEFSGLQGGGGSQAGLLLSSEPPAVGRSFRDFWVRTPGSWELYVISPDLIPPAYFVALVMASDGTQEPDPPELKLEIKQESGELRLTWPASAILQAASGVNGPYADVEGAVSPHTVEVGATPRMFWRLRPPPEAPLQLLVRREGGSLVLEWSGAAHLEAASEANGDYIIVPGAESPFTAGMDGADRRFWRLRQ